MNTKFRYLALPLLLTLLCACAARADITSNLALYLTLDETSGLTVTDSGPNGNNGAVVSFVAPSVPWITNGRIAGAAQVNIPAATTQYISVPQSSTLDFGTANAYTVAAWVMSTGTQLAGSAILCKGNGGGNEQYDLDINGGKFRLVTRNAGGTATTVTSTVGPTANWQHVAGVFDGTAKTLRIYVNGQLNATTSSANLSSVRTSSHELSIGNRQSGSGAYNLPFVSGSIDDVHIYGRALTASDIFELYASHGKAPIISAQPRSYSCYAGDIAAFAVTVDAVNSIVPVSYQWQLNGTNIPGATSATLGITNVTTAVSGQFVTVNITNVIGTTTSTPALLTVSPMPAADIASGLVGYYRFDDVAGSTTAADSTTNATPGTLANFADTTVCWTNGLIAGGLNFNGDVLTADLVAIPDVFTPVPPVLDFSVNGMFSLAAWVNGATTQTNGAAVFAKGTGNGGEQFAVDISGGRYRFYLRNASNTVSTVQTAIVPNNTWQHLICVLNTAKGTLNVYINGQLAGEAIAPFSLLSNAHEISIGNRQSGTGAYNLPWSGIIDDVRFYNRDLSAADAQALYLTGGVFPPTLVTTPVGASLFVGDNFKFAGLANGTFPLSYQWIRSGTVLPGATNTSLIFTPTVSSNAGDYTLLVTNAYGSITSSIATLQLTPFTLTNALAGYWTFDDGANSTIAADASTNANNGALLNFPDFTSEWVLGRTNGALNFNAAGGPVNEYVEIPDAVSLNFDTVSNFTLAAWVRGPVTQISGAGIITKGFGSLNEQYTLDVFGGFYRFYVRNAASTASQVLAAIAPNGHWQHLVATYDGTFTTMNLYVNGVLAATTAAAPPTLLADNGHSVSIGCREQNAGSGYNFPFVGAIDDVRIYRRTLSSNDVQSLYQAAGIQAPVYYQQPISGAALFVGDNLTLTAIVDGTAPLSYQWQKDTINISGATNLSLAITNAQLTNAGTYNLVVSNQGGSVPSSPSLVQVTAFSITNMAGYFKFDETSGTTAVDSSGNTNTATLTSFPGDDSEWVPGRINGGLDFNRDASGQTVVTAADSPTLNFSNKLSFSLVAWVKGPPAQANGAGIVAKGAGAGGEEYALDVHTDVVSGPAYRFFVRSAAGVSSPLPTSVTPNGRWQHLAATFDGNSAVMSVYVNGQSVASVVAPTSLLPTAHEVSIGNRQSGALTGYNLPFTGEIDDVRIYARALKASEIQSIYALAAPFGPVVYTQPADSSHYTGTQVTFAPVVDGTDPLAYQWLKNSNPIPGATNATLTLTNLQLANAGAYSLHVTNSLGSTNTLAANLQVLPLQFAGAVQLSDGTFQLTLSGPPNGSYSIYSSTDVTLPLAQWTLLTTGTFDGSGAATFVDQNVSNVPTQFYRFSLP